ncbi:PPC domain-containing protein [Okeania sp.]|uniref:PPC domain-containing protein n=1 Tax=Okeania sp. TaxID=3100323 RepID=UPI002B4B156F|nr:PPC domain-containing protein [Okeania sp.]MEB3341575.1 PPC domain-containing protein [Okeania sp.]
MDIDSSSSSLFSTIETEAEDTNSLFSPSNYETNYSAPSPDISLQSLASDDYINSVEYLLDSQDLEVNELQYISTDYATFKNLEIDSITGDRSDIDIQLRAGKKSDDTFKTATEIDIISGEKIRINDRIGYKENGNPDKHDYYNFSLSENAEVSIQLDKLKKNANLNLFDETGKKVLEKSNQKGKQSENITEYLEAGDYYFRVSAVGTAKTPYRLTLETISDDRSIEGANNLGKLSNKTVKFKDKIGYRENGKRDEIDVYSFEIQEERKVDISLDKLKQDSHIKLIDEDGETVLDKSTNKGKKSETITEILEPGTYYLEVSAPGKAKTNYELSFSSEKVNKIFPQEGIIYESGTQIGFENRVSLEIPEGWFGQIPSEYDNNKLNLTSKEYPGIYVEVSNNYLTGSIQELANIWSQETEIGGVTFEPQGKANVKGNQITNTYITKNSQPQEKFYVVNTVGFNNETGIVLVGGPANKLKDDKDIANKLVESLDFPEPTDWESYLSDRWLSYYYNSDFLEFDYNLNGVIDPWEELSDLEIIDGIFLYGDSSFNRLYSSYSEVTGNLDFNLSGTWDITQKDELALYNEDGSLDVKKLTGPDIDNEIFYGELTYEVRERD